MLFIRTAIRLPLVTSLILHNWPLERSSKAIWWRIPSATALPTHKGASQTSDGASAASDGTLLTRDGIPLTSDGILLTSDGTPLTSDGASPVSSAILPTAPSWPIAAPLQPMMAPSRPEAQRPCLWCPDTEHWRRYHCAYGALCVQHIIAGNHTRELLYHHLPLYTCLHQQSVHCIHSKVSTVNNAVYYVLWHNPAVQQVTRFLPVLIRPWILKTKSSHATIHS